MNKKQFYILNFFDYELNIDFVDIIYVKYRYRMINQKHLNNKYALTLIRKIYA